MVVTINASLFSTFATNDATVCQIEFLGADDNFYKFCFANVLSYQFPSNLR